MTFHPILHTPLRYVACQLLEYINLHEQLDENPDLR